MKKLICLLLMLSSCLFAQKPIHLLSTDRPVISVEINGIKCNMLLDTGSSLNIIDINCVNDLGIKKKHAIGDINSASGKSIVYRLGNFTTKILDTDITQFVGMGIETVSESVDGSTGIKISGILGTPAIKELGMIINLSRGIVTIKADTVK